MDLGQLGNMLVRMVMRQAVNLGIKKGVDFAARRGKPQGQMTDAERAQAQGAKDMAKRARQAARAARRLGR